jgi:exodeoxyribonuclease V beta subunit
MLREHAFDSGSLFTQSLETDHSDLLGEVLRDYWRLFCYPMQGDALNWVRSNWGGPAALLPRVRGLFASERDTDEGKVPAELIAECLLERRAALVELKAPCRRVISSPGSTSSRPGPKTRRLSNWTLAPASPV